MLYNLDVDESGEAELKSFVLGQWDKRAKTRYEATATIDLRARSCVTRRGAC